MAETRQIKGGPVGADWDDVLDIKISKYKDAGGVWVSRCASVRKRAGVSYVLVNPTTGEVAPLREFASQTSKNCDLPHSLPTKRCTQYLNEMGPLERALLSRFCLPF